MKPAARTPGTFSIVLVVVLFVLSTLYVLSIGPVMGLFARGYLSVEAMNAIDKIYWPLDVVCSVASPLQRSLDTYRNLWLPKQALLPFAPPLPVLPPPAAPPSAPLPPFKK